MIKLYVFSALIFISQFTNAQWSAVTNPDINDWFEDVHFLDANTGYTAGRDGVIYKTTNGGQNWTRQVAPYKSVLLSVFFFDYNTGWVSGRWHDTTDSHNTLFRTTDGGNNWISLSPDDSELEDITDVQFVSATQGWTVGDDRIMHTQDGGDTWTDQTPASIDGYMYALYFVNATTGWVVTSQGAIYNTTDGGANWTEQTTPTKVAQQTLYDIFFINSTTGWAAGEDGVVVKTTDGGANWTQVAFSIASQAGCDVEGLYFTSATTGYASGCWDDILKTTDGGATWSVGFADVGFGTKLHFTNASNGWIVGSNGVARTTNGGVTTAIDEPAIATGQLIYPNPATNTLYINSTGAQLQTLAIYNYTGSLLYLQPVTGNTIDISTLPNGSYLVKLQDKQGQVATQKLVIAK